MKDVSPSEAVRIQKNLAARVRLQDDFGKIQVIAGADVAFDESGGIAGVIVYRYPELTEVERVSARGRLRFPYVPGLLTFREGPILLKAFGKLKTKPDLILFDGQGIAHPRGFGLASHMGLLLDTPTIGCAKSLLCGDYREPGPNRGDRSPLVYRGRQVGVILRTRDRVKPIFVSPGHKVSLRTAVKIALHCVEKFRVPKPTREADLWVGQLKALE